MFLIETSLLVAAGVLLLTAIALTFIFYIMYHTFHGNLPKIMAWVILGFAAIGAIVLAVSFFF